MNAPILGVYDLNNKYVFLSHIIENSTPIYGNKNIVEIADGQLLLSAHTGTHIDFPGHFFEGAPLVNSFDAGFFVFVKPLIVEIKPKDKIIKDELICALTGIEDSGFDILLVKICGDISRNSSEYVLSGYGFAPELAYFLKDMFASLRVFGFDAISISSFSNRTIGREAHKAFLFPQNPILLLEDMDLSQLCDRKLKSIFVLPLRVDGFDGAPCTVVGEFYD